MANLPSPDELIVDRGLISDDTDYSEAVIHAELSLGLYEYHDVLAVAYGKKPIAMIWLNSPYTRGINADNIRAVMQLCTENNVHAMHYKCDDHCYDTIFFREEHRECAVKLAMILWHIYPCHNSLYQFAIGYFLGYLYENIKEYFRHNQMHDLTDDYISIYIQHIEKIVPHTMKQLKKLNVQFIMPYQWKLRSFQLDYY